MSSPDNNIIFFLNEKDDDNDYYHDEEEEEEEEEEEDIMSYSSHFLEEMDKVEKDTDIISVINGYESSCNVKDIVKIGEYYGVHKQLTKLKKLEMIYIIVLFENDGNNADIVLKRKQLWFYMEELKQDKFMRRFIIW